MELHGRRGQAAGGEGMASVDDGERLGQNFPPRNIFRAVRAEAACAVPRHAQAVEQGLEGRGGGDEFQPVSVTSQGLERAAHAVEQGVSGGQHHYVVAVPCFFQGFPRLFPRVFADGDAPGVGRGTGFQQGGGGVNALCLCQFAKQGRGRLKRACAAGKNSQGWHGGMSRRRLPEKPEIRKRTGRPGTWRWNWRCASAARSR